ncbi:MAG: right-handed parallel beta-helix repeat-containing protein, partial [Chloroflexota bacterium]|nr:right-handed parallel beta-helix repeat-containing protein [Chloroflexota bacterium]
MSAFEAEDMFELNPGVMVVSDEDASEEQSLQYAQNALAARFGQAFSADANRLEIVARGQMSEGQWPQMRVFVDGQDYATNAVATATVNSPDYATYAFPVNVSAGTHDIYVKALSSATDNAKLWVDKVTFTYQEHPRAGTNGVLEAADNCPDANNPNQADADGASVVCEESPRVVCDKFTSPSGSNTNAGTISAPFATAQKLVDALQPGEVGCLRGGYYTEPDRQVNVRTGGTSASARKVIQNYPGEKVTICAQISLPDGTDYVTFRADVLGNLELDGTCAPRSLEKTNRGRYSSLASPQVLGDFNEFLRVDVNKDIRRYASGGYTDAELEKTGVCFILGSMGNGIAAKGTLIQDSAIHHCGVTKEMWARGPDNHGIYASRSVNGRFVGNLIYSNGERGIQLYPNADGNTISGNIFDSNGENVVIGGAYNQRSEYNEIRNNVIADADGVSPGWNVNDNWNLVDNVPGVGNSVHDNCVWADNPDDRYRVNGGINPAATGLDAYGNVIARPRYEAPQSGDYDLLPGNACQPLL